jgi:hypothetical protein
VCRFPHIGHHVQGLAIAGTSGRLQDIKPCHTGAVSGGWLTSEVARAVAAAKTAFSRARRHAADPARALDEQVPR